MKYRDKATDFLIGAIAAAFERKDLDFSMMSLAETVYLLASDLSELNHFDQLSNHLDNFVRDEVAVRLIETLEQEKNAYGGIHIARIMGPWVGICLSRL